MRKLTAAALLLCLLAFAASAQALPYTFNLVNPSTPGDRIEVTADYALLSPGSAMATFTLHNYLTAPRGIVDFAFNLPNDGAGVTSVSLASTTNPYFHLVSLANPYTSNSIISPYSSSFGPFDVGLSVGPTFHTGTTSGNLGILNGQLATFSLIFSGSGQLFSYTDVQSLMAALTLDEAPSHRAYASSLPLEAAPTPIPAAVWLLGSGLAGLVGFRRRRKAA